MESMIVCRPDFELCSSSPVSFRNGGNMEGGVWGCQYIKQCYLFLLNWFIYVLFFRGGVAV